jgi:hypothetical protein
VRLKRGPCCDRSSCLSHPAESDNAAGHLGTEQRPQIRAAEAAVGGVLGRIGGWCRHNPKDPAGRVNHVHAGVPRSCHIEIPSDVDAKAVPAAGAKVLNDPFAPAVGVEAHEPVFLDDHDMAIMIESDPIGEDKVVREQ